MSRGEFANSGEGGGRVGSGSKEEEEEVAGAWRCEHKREEEEDFIKYAL